MFVCDRVCDIFQTDERERNRAVTIRFTQFFSFFVGCLAGSRVSLLRFWSFCLFSFDHPFFPWTIFHVRSTALCCWYDCFSAHMMLQYPFFPVNTLTNFRVYLIHFSVSWWHTTFTASKVYSRSFFRPIIRSCNWCGIDSSSTHTLQCNLRWEHRKIEWNEIRWGEVKRVPIWLLDFFYFLPDHISKTENCPTKFDKIDNLSNINTQTMWVSFGHIYLLILYFQADFWMI